jgi:hypothetical protein
VSRRVARSQDLYSKSRPTARPPLVLRRLSAALEEFDEAINTRDRRRFKALMESARRYFAPEGPRTGA